MRANIKDYVVFQIAGQCAVWKCQFDVLMLTDMSFHTFLECPYLCDLALSAGYIAIQTRLQQFYDLVFQPLLISLHPAGSNFTTCTIQSIQLTPRLCRSIGKRKLKLFLLNVLTFYSRSGKVDMAISLSLCSISVA